MRTSPIVLQQKKTDYIIIMIYEDEPKNIDNNKVKMTQKMKTIPKNEDNPKNKNDPKKGRQPPQRRQPL